MALYKPTEVLTGDMDFCIAYSLVDITDSGVSNPKNFTVEYQQAQNLNTLMQILSMRTQIVLSSVAVLENEDLTKYDFGSDYTGNHRVWMLKFASEKPDIWDKGEIKMFYAYSDVHLTPIHINLTETVSLENTFVTTDTTSRNLYFENKKIL